DWVFSHGSKDGPNRNVSMSRGIVEKVVRSAVESAVKESLASFGNNIGSVPELSDMVGDAVTRATKNVIAAFAGMLVEAAVFVEFELTDLAETQHYGVRLSLAVGKSFAEAGLRWIATQILGLIEYIADPSGIGPAGNLAEEVYLKVKVYAGVSPPRFLRMDGAGQLEVGVEVGVNIPVVSGILGRDTGEKRVRVGVVAEDVPTAAMPPTFKLDPDLRSDLFLLEAEFSWE
ncbi:MAG: hypothetical protein GX224_00380, partial [Thermoplasmatales archaeon]|nr:hypothetical protein [Thermoplasmatales archaeon]